MFALFALLAACQHGGDDSTPTASNPTGGWAGSAPDAPWQFQVKTALWATTSRGDSAYLLLSSGDPTCDDLLDVYSNDFFGSFSGDSGVLLVPEREGFAASDSFEGLYLTGYGYTSGDQASYGLQGGAFNDGVFWSLGYYGGGMWLRIDQDTPAGVSGEFYAVWWSGTFDAENCGEVDEPHNNYYYESGYGYYTGGYSDTTYGTDYGTYYYGHDTY